MTTVVILDLAHHGTTMLAGCCEILGVPMVGAKFKPNKWEDQDIIESLNDELAFASLVSGRNQRSVWGFKYPGAWMFADLLNKYLCQPIYLAIYKDPVSVTRRRFGKLSTGKLRNTIRQMEDSIDGIRTSGLDVQLLSYQDAIVDPCSFCAQLITLAGLSVTQEQLSVAVDYIKPNRGYQSVGEWLT